MSERTPQTKVTFVSDYTSSDGKGVYEGGKTYSVDARDARIYVNIGKASVADEGTRAHREPTPTTAKKPRASRSRAAVAPATNVTTGATAATDNTEGGK